MEYRSLKGDFGVFSGEINFKSGLNTVFAENESGKSTFCAFTKAMLYGVSTSQRETAERLPDKVKYLPWSGRPMNGRLVLHKDGRDIVLSRTSEHGPLKDFTDVYADTSEPVLGLDGSNAGEVLCGVDAEVFEKTAFCSADSLAVKNSEALEAAVAAAIGAGGEESSPSTADARLAAWQRERKNGKKGRIP
ncbi:MAG: AAA family ATPase, partial [Clostridia bacterium]|nr:AAA family ATPase [Clostridia bacterium]